MSTKCILWAVHFVYKSNEFSTDRMSNPRLQFVLVKTENLSVFTPKKKTKKTIQL